MENELTIKKDISPEAVTFTLSGRIYTSNADVLEMHLEEALKEKRYNLVLNMSQVDYISSIGIRVILKTYMDTKKAGGKLEIENPSDSVRKILKITALEEMLVPSASQQEEVSKEQPNT